MNNDACKVFEELEQTIETATKNTFCYSQLLVDLKIGFQPNLPMSSGL